jgi:outer membrane protein TolC
MLLTVLSIYLCSLSVAHAGTLVLDELIGEALTNNPSITASENLSDAARERISQAGTLDDPMLSFEIMSVEVDNLAFDRIPMTSKNIGLSQRFPYFGKLNLKEGMAESEADAASRMVGEDRLMLAYKVKAAYFGLCLVKREIEILDKQAGLIRLIGKTARARYSVGDGTLSDSLKAEVEEARLIETRETLMRQDRTIRAMLGNLTGRGHAVEGEPVWPVSTCDPPGRDELVRMALDSRPGIRAADAMIEKGRKMSELAELGYYPDMGVSVTYQLLENLRDGMRQSDRVTAMLSFNLPVWRESKLDPALREAASMKASAESQKDSLINDISYTVDSLLSDIQREDELVRLYGDALLPLGRKELDVELDRYGVGEMDLSDLLSTARELYEYELGSDRAVIGRASAVAGLEATVGVSADAWCMETIAEKTTYKGKDDD